MDLTSSGSPVHPAGGPGPGYARARHAEVGSLGSYAEGDPAPAPAETEVATKAKGEGGETAGGTGTKKNAAPETVDPKVVRLMIVGDSTAADFEEGGIYQGWGHFLQQHFAAETVQVINDAKKGRTARSFIDQGAWKDVLKQKPTIVLLQFGHNEVLNQMAHPTDEATVLREYKKYMSAYVDTAHKAGVQTVILTPTHRFELATPKDQLAPFVEMSRQVAENRGVPLVDVYTACDRVYRAIGAEKMKQLQASVDDPVHFGRMGAWIVAAIVAQEIAHVDVRLEKALIPTKPPEEGEPSAGASTTSAPPAPPVSGAASSSTAGALR